MNENLDQEQESIDPDDWYNYYSNLGNPLVNTSEHFDQAFYDDVTNPSHQNKFMNNAGLDCLITEIEVDKAIKSLKSNKQPGHDGIRAEMIYHAIIYLCKPLTKLFKFIWVTEKVPVSWSDGLICPIHKGPKNDPGNFRGVNLLSSVGKLFQIVFRNRLDHWAKDVLIDNQTGFKSGYSTIDNIFVLNTLLEKFRSQKKKLYVCFVDFKKAFDYVDRTLLWCKLMQIGLSTKSINILKSMYKSVNLFNVKWVYSKVQC